MNEILTAFVGAKISEFRKKMAEVKRMARDIPNKITVEVKAKVKEAEKRINNFQSAISRIANSIQALDTIARNTGGGLMLMVSPTIIPILATIIGLLGTLGPMLGTVAGSAFALGTAFGFAGTAAIAFGAVAIPTIQKLFDETEKLTSAQKAAKAQYTKFQKTWQGIAKDLEQPVLDAFSKSMQIANKILKMARPLFDSAAKAVNNLLDSLDRSLNAKPLKDFFDYMNKSAGPMLETIGKGLGYMMQGFMNMMTAFGPLAEQTAQGFLNMNKSFAEWAAGLSKSEKFQVFVNYINENMPKIRAIFRDALAGTTYFFAAFGPLSSDMMTSLQDMMDKFKEWASSLSSNQSFQKFISYIRENAPKVIELIGNLTDFIINLAVGLAPLGSVILDVVNNFLSWINSMMQAHPIIGQIIAVIVMLTGFFIALIPNIIALATLFPGLGGAMVSMFTRVLSIFLPFKGSFLMGLQMIGQNLLLLSTKVLTTAVQIIGAFLRMSAQAVVWVAKFIAQVAIKIAQWALMGTKALFHAARVAAAWFIALGPVGWVIATVIALVVLIIANWDKVKEWTIKIWTIVANWVKESWSKIVSATSEATSKVYNWAREKFNQTKEAINTAMQNARSKVQEIWSNIKSFFSTTLSNIVQTVKTKFTEFVNSVREKMNDAYNKVKELWNKAQSFLEGIDLVEIGKNIIQGLINGIGSMASAAVDKVTGIANDIKGAIQGALDIHSPSRFMDWIGRMFGTGLVNGMSSMNKYVARAANKMAEVAKVEPQQTQLAFDASISTAGFKNVRGELNPQISKETYETNESYEGMFKGANFYVREEQDIEKIARELEMRRKLKGGRV